MCSCNSNFVGSQEEKDKLEKEIQKLKYQVAEAKSVLNSSAPTYVKEKYAVKIKGILNSISEKEEKLKEEPKKNVLAPNSNLKKYALIGALGIVGFVLARKFIFK